eukprot:SAG22_NODE_3409_length_1730_cov_1.484365_2_plen_65_part_00
MQPAPAADHDPIASLARIHHLERKGLEEIAAYWGVDPGREPHLLPTVIQAATAPLVSASGSSMG